MHLRYDVYQVYCYILVFSLLAMGGIALASGSYISETHTAVLAPGSALFLTVAGLAILSVLRQWWRVRMLTAGLLLGIATLPLISGNGGPLLSSDPAIIEAFRVRSALALVSLLLAAVLLGSLWMIAARNRLAHLLGLAILAIGVISSFSYGNVIPEGARLSAGFEFPFLVDFFVILLGGAAWLLPYLSEQQQSLDRRSALFGFGGVFLTCLVGYAFGQQVIDSTSQRSEQFLSRVQASTERALSAQLASIQRMASRWEVTGRYPAQHLWGQEALSYLQDFPEIELIAVLDGSLQPRWLEERVAEPRERLQHFEAITAQRDWIRHIQAKHEPHFSRAIPLNATNNSVLLAAPFRLAKSEGVIIASLDVSDILSDVLSDERSRFAVQVYQDEQRLFDSGGVDGDGVPVVLDEKILSLHHDVRWRLVSYQIAQSMHLSAMLPTLAILFGLCFSFFLTLSQRLAHLANERSRHLKHLNQELKISLQAQANLEAWNQRVTRYSMDVLCTLDEHGRFTQLSPSCESVFGYRPEEMLGRRFSEFTIPEDRERTLAIFTRNMKLGGKEAPLFRNRYRHKNGSTVHVAWSAAWSEEEQSALAIAQDITRLAQSEAFIEGQRRILEMISTNVPVAATLNAICEVGEMHFPGTRYSVLLVDKEGRRLVHGASPSLPAGFIQKVNGMPIGPEMGTCGAAAFHQALVVTEDIANDPGWEAYRTLALSHGLRACSSNPIKDSNGEVLGTFAIYQNEAQSPSREQLEFISAYGNLAAIAIERERDRLSLEDSEQRFRSLFEYNPNPVFSFDAEGSILSINQAGCDLAGFASDAVVGKHFSAFVINEDLPHVQENFQAVLTGDPRRYEVKLLTNQGETKEMDIVSLPMVVDDQVVGVFGIGKDMTEHKAAERALHATLQELERSNRDLQDFAFVASHDLQEPLRKIQAFSERLSVRAAGLDDEGRDYLGRMNAAAGRMQSLIRDLLAYSRIGTQAKAFVELDLNQILADVLQDMETSLKESQAQVECGTLPPLQGDATQIRQLLQNLLSNAVKFRQTDEPPQINIYAENLASGEWTLCVADQGIGFDEKYLDRIFNPFQRLHARQAYAGTGIGLAIVKKIAERHGARITATSFLGQGTTFRISFEQ